MLRMLNLGCGKRFHPDWVNVDFCASAPEVLACDLSQGLPFPDADFDVVYHSHVLEHFPRPHGLGFLCECRRVLKPGDRVLTFVARHLEPYRGFHVLMRALPEIQRRNPDAVAVVVGGDSVSYGRAPEGAANWREKLLGEVGERLDLSRVFFTGQLPYAAYRSLLQVSAAHAYLTYPFVLSWSALEAMSCGCLLVASNTPPVAEVMTHGRNALLFDFFDLEALAARLESRIQA